MKKREEGGRGWGDKKEGKEEEEEEEEEGEGRSLC